MTDSGSRDPAPGRPPEDQPGATSEGTGYSDVGRGSAEGGEGVAAQAGDELAEELAAAGDSVLLEVMAERDQYLDALQRVKAEFDNYRRRTERERTEVEERAAGKVGSELLAVLDACDAAIEHGSTDVEPIRKALLEALGRGGLERMEPEGQPFDPNEHDAVLHEPAVPDEQGGGSDSQTSVVTEVLRAGYKWGSQVLRPAMVKVRG